MIEGDAQLFPVPWWYTYVKVAQYLGGDLKAALSLNQVWFDRVVISMKAENEARAELERRRSQP